MKEHVYRISKRKVVAQSFSIWLMAATQIVANCLVIPKFLNTSQYGVILFINVVLGIITIPSVYIFFNYMKYSLNKDFIITYNSLKLVDRKNNTITELSSAEIEKIELYQNLYPHSIAKNLLPWSSQEYFCFIDKNGKKIIVTSFIMNIGEFWMDSLARRVSIDKLTKYEKSFPVIKE